MDVHNVGDRYSHILISQRQTLQKAKSRQGQRPRDLTSREDAIALFIYTLREMHKISNQGSHMVHTSLIPPAYPPCITPVPNLRRIVIKDLQLETHHRGTYLLLRSITPPSRMTAIIALMEDETGDVMLLQLY